MTTGRIGRLAPLAFATMASQALLVVLAPIIVSVARDLDASVSAVGQARALTAAVAVAISVWLSTRIGQLGVARVIAVGGALAIASCGIVAAAPSLGVFLAAHVLLGVAFACLVSGGFAGVGAFPAGERARATGYVAASNAVAWIVINPLAGALAERASWRLAFALPAAFALAALLTVRGAEPLPARSARLPLRTFVAEASARRWIVSETVAFGTWTALLTFIGAFFIAEVGLSAAAAGWALAGSAAAYFAASVRSGWLVARFPRRRLVAAGALVMAGLVPLLLTVGHDHAAVAVLLFCLVGGVAGVRTPSSTSLGLEQLPNDPGAMMAVRAGATQLGYLIGAVSGGIVIAAGGYVALGPVLAVGLVASALLVLRVRDPLEDRFGPRAPLAGES